jgi:hypothetical protein
LAHGFSGSAWRGFSLAGLSLTRLLDTPEIKAQVSAEAARCYLENVVHGKSVREIAQLTGLSKSKVGRFIQDVRNGFAFLVSRIAAAPCARHRHARCGSPLAG